MKAKIIGTIEFVAVWSYIIGAVYVIGDTIMGEFFMVALVAIIYEGLLGNL